MGGEERGYDGGKKVKGSKRHILVDTEGFVLKAKIHSAKVLDQVGIKMLLQGADGQSSRASRTCGWTRATAQRTRAPIGCARLRDGVWTSSSAPESQPPKRC